MRPAVLLNSLIRSRQLRQARAQFAQLLEQGAQPSLLETLFNFTPLLFDSPDRKRVWQILLDRLDRLVRQRQGRVHPHAIALRLRLLLALRDYAGFLKAMDCLAGSAFIGPYGPRLRALADTLREPHPCAVEDKPKIFGIGLSKTATTSLGLALHQLGYQVLDWHNPLTRELICQDDYPLFDAFTDTPSAAVFENLYGMFSQSRFIYTTRPLESWTRSMTGHWLRNYGVIDFGAIRALLATGDAFPFGTAFADLHSSLYFKHPNLEAAYHAHDLRVRAFFQDKPRQRFLELNVFAGDGWAALCQFLDRPIPPQSFPWANRSPSCDLAAVQPRKPLNAG